MDPAALGSRLARRWWLVVAVAALTVVGAVTAVASSADEQRTTIQFVMRPDVSVSNDDLPGTLEALKSDGPLVQTVIGVLSSPAILRRAADEAGVELGPGYSVKATARPSSTLIDSTLTGPDRAVLGRLAAGYTSAASNYVAAGYPAYVLDRLSTTPGKGGTGPGATQVVILALLLGAALGVALVAAEVRFEPQLRRLLGQGGAERPAAAESRAEPEPRRAEPDAKRETRPRPKPDAKPAREPDAKPAREPDAKPAREPDAKPEPVVRADHEPQVPEAGPPPRPRAPTPPVARPAPDGRAHPRPPSKTGSPSHPGGGPMPGVWRRAPIPHEDEE
jgi:hypothetical protein